MLEGTFSEYCDNYREISLTPVLKVYEEKERVWERELRKIKGLYENRLKANQQKASKMEQALMNQTLQVAE